LQRRGIELSKIFCKDCKYVERIAYPDVCLCTHEKNTTIKPDPYKSYESYETIKVANKNNDCKYFKCKRSFLEKLDRFIRYPLF
jgi:hypothetical protein